MRDVNITIKSIKEFAIVIKHKFFAYFPIIVKEINYSKDVNVLTQNVNKQLQIIKFH